MKGPLVRAEDRNVEESLDLGNGIHLENVGKFCYLGDKLNGGGGENSASVARVRCAWRKFKELSGILTRKEVSFKLKSEECYGDEDSEIDAWCIAEK